MSKAELNELAKTFDIATPVKIKKDDLIAEILEVQAQRSGLEKANGVLDVLPEGYGFLRRDGYLIGPDDIYISQSQIRRFELRRGDLVAGQVRRPKDNEKYYGIVKVETVNGFDPESLRSRRNFDELGAIAPSQRWKLESKKSISGRALDLFAPLGRGQRALVAVPPKVDPSTMLAAISTSILDHHPEAHVIVLLIDCRPEDVAQLQRHIDGEIVASTFDERADHHIATAELVMERAKRLVEVGADVVIVLDSLTRLSRAYLQTGPQNNRNAVDPVALAKPKLYFGNARAVEEGGSLTIVATVASGSESPADAALLDEVTSVANCEIVLSRELASARITPPLDVRDSYTRYEELLLGEIELRRLATIRKATATMSVLGMSELLFDKLATTKTNEDFLVALTDGEKTRSR